MGDIMSTEEKDNQTNEDDDLSEDEMITKEIEKLDNELNGELTEQDKENMKKILKFLGVNKKRHKAQVFFSFFKNLFFNFLWYFLIYFALYGMFNQSIKLKNSYDILIFNIILAFYQSLFKGLLGLNNKRGLTNIFVIIIFWILSEIILNNVIEITGFINFSNWAILSLYYIVGEFIYIAIKFYISKHMINKLFK